MICFSSEKLKKHKNKHETGPRGSKIKNSGFIPHQFFGPELMVTVISLKTMIFDYFLIFYCFDVCLFFCMFGVTRWDNLIRLEAFLRGDPGGRGGPPRGNIVLTS